MKRTREQRSQASKAAWANDPARRLRHVRRMRRRWADPAYRERMRQAARERMQTIAIRKRIAAALRKLWRKPERKQAASEQMRRQWQDPRYRRKRVAAMHGLWRDEATRRRMAQATKRRWRDPAGRRKMVRGLTRAWRDPEVRERRVPISIRNLGPSRGARRLHRLLGPEWFLEFYTRHGFVDIANPTERIVIEVDGRDHEKPEQRRRDERKQRGLRRDGWTVYRVDEYRCRALPRQGA